MNEKNIYTKNKFALQRRTTEALIMWICIAIIRIIICPTKTIYNWTRPQINKSTLAECKKKIKKKPQLYILV